MSSGQKAEGSGQKAEMQKAVKRVKSEYPSLHPRLYAVDRFAGYESIAELMKR